MLTMAAVHFVGKSDTEIQPNTEITGFKTWQVEVFLSLFSIFG
jgi:hypothetical protein